jgi:hypothetical protein
MRYTYLCFVFMCISTEKFKQINDDNEMNFNSKIGFSLFSVKPNENYTFQQQTAEALKRYTVQVAKQTHIGLQRIFLFIHGINSGYALWVCIFAFVFANDNLAAQFFETYRTIALITHALFYLFLALCIVDVLDR